MKLFYEYQIKIINKHLIESKVAFDQRNSFSCMTHWTISLTSFHLICMEELPRRMIKNYTSL